MRPSHHHGIAASVAVAALALAAPPATADIFATLDTVRAGGTDSDLRKVNVTTGVTAALPAGVNTPDHEIHPALSPDRTKMVFRRAGRLIMVDLATGRSADLFTASEASADSPRTPVFSPDGKAVLTGRFINGTSESQPSFISTDVTRFPDGPFPHTVVPANGARPETQQAWETAQPTFGAGGLFAFRIFYGFGFRSIIVGTATLSESRDVYNPAISAQAGIVVFKRFLFPTSQSSATVLASRPLNAVASASSTLLPAIVNASGTTVSEPAFSADGRFLAFLRASLSDTRQRRLFVLDTLTQTLLNPSGIPVPAFAGSTGLSNEAFLLFEEGATALDVKELLINPSVLNTTISFTLVRTSGVGILVQRIVGTTRFLGRKAPKLKRVGRVPLGRFKAGRRHRVPWDHRVNGKRLRRGRYLVTVRAVTAKGKVRDLGKPVRVTIR